MDWGLSRVGQLPVGFGSDRLWELTRQAAMYSTVRKHWFWVWFGLGLVYWSVNLLLEWSRINLGSFLSEVP